MGETENNVHFPKSVDANSCVLYPLIDPFGEFQFISDTNSEGSISYEKVNIHIK